MSERPVGGPKANPEHIRDSSCQAAFRIQVRLWQILKSCHIAEKLVYRSVGMPNWNETRLSKAVDGKLTRKEQTALSLALDQAQSVLRSTSTAPIDFTLHDQDHSFRVAERIFDLIIPDVSLGPYELALLLLGSYMHDIGMSPSRKIVRAHNDYLLTGLAGDLTPQHLKDFQHWLDAHYNGVTAPISPDALTPSNLRTVEEIVSYYCRHKHNDWSEEWIRNALPELQSSLYANWVEDLVTLCRSHHEGLSALRSERFEAKLVGAPSQSVNLRYLAALLRLADVLEFDPERTPSIILERRDIAPKSRIFWQRDHEIAFHLDAENRSISLTARTPSAPVHRAVLDVVLSVDHELATCAALEHEGLFRVGKIPDIERDRYKWEWPSRLATDISEKDNSFVYIEGAFRPDSKRILDLLSGVALYGNPLAAIRELLQNAVDAVKEQIAYERLEDDEPGSSDFSPKWSEFHRIRLSLEEDIDGIWLRCVDNGVGMTKDIIENHLLVSGSAARVSTRTLEREADAKGFAVGRTGQFGVGALSYFMIADRLELTTRRSNHAGDHDHTAWRFTTEGIGSFGELSRASRSTNGTEARLRLRADIFDINTPIFSQISQYILDTVSFLPCRMEFKDNINGGPALQFAAGWVDSSDMLSDYCLELNKRGKRMTELRDGQANFKSDARNRLRWLGPEELTFEPLAARIRVWLPYFELPGGNSCVYLHLEDDAVVQLRNNDQFLVPQRHAFLSWRGFKAISRDPIKLPANVSVEIDLGAGATISVDRGHLSFPTDDIFEAISEVAQKLRSSFANENIRSQFKVLNLGTLNIGMDDDSGFYWQRESDKWSAVEAPFAEVLKFSYEREPTGGRATNNGREVQRVLTMGSSGSQRSVSRLVGGGRLVLTRDNSRYSLLQAAVIWDTMPSEFRRGARSFPESLRGLLCVVCDGQVALNKDHALAAALTRHRRVDPANLDANCSDDELASALYSTIHLPTEAWSTLVSKVGMRERILEFIDRLPERRIDAWTVSSPNQYIITIDSKGRHTRKQDFRINRFNTYDGRNYILPSEERDWLRIEGPKFEDEDKEPQVNTISF